MKLSLRTEREKAKLKVQTEAPAAVRAPWLLSPWYHRSFFPVLHPYPFNLAQGLRVARAWSRRANLSAFSNADSN